MGGADGNLKKKEKIKKIMSGRSLHEDQNPNASVYFSVNSPQNPDLVNNTLAVLEVDVVTHVLGGPKIHLQLLGVDARGVFIIAVLVGELVRFLTLENQLDVLLVLLNRALLAQPKGEPHKPIV